MKKWFVYILMVTFAAGFAGAEEKSPWWKLGFGGDAEEQVAPEQMHQRPQGDSPEMQRDPRRGKISEEQRAKMKAEREAIHALAEAARSEEDPVKKAELTEQLRAKLTEGAEKMQEQFRKRLEKAEAGVVKMRERLEKGEADMAKRVEEHLQKLLAGEKPERKKGPGAEGQRRKGPTPTE